MSVEAAGPGFCSPTHGFSPARSCTSSTPAAQRALDLVLRSLSITVPVGFYLVMEVAGSITTQRLRKEEKKCTHAPVQGLKSENTEAELPPKDSQHCPEPCGV